MSRQANRRQSEPHSAAAEHEALSDDPVERGKELGKAFQNPATAHGALSHALLNGYAGGVLDQGDMMVALSKRLEKLRMGEMGSVSDTLAAQAASLDAIYVDFTRRALLNLGEYPQAVERYMRLALKAQAQSRATLEALAKLHQPREQTVRHVHVDNRGRQAVIAETLNTGGQGNGQSAGQAHATATVGSGGALLGADALGWAMPVASGEGAEKVPDARRD